jgi:hypothetical protein
MLEQQMTENRDNNNLASINSQIMSGNQDMWSGMMGVAKAGVYAANNVDWSGKEAKRNKTWLRLVTIITLDECRCFFRQVLQVGYRPITSLSKPAV